MQLSYVYVNSLPFFFVFYTFEKGKNEVIKNVRGDVFKDVCKRCCFQVLGGVSHSSIVRWIDGLLIPQ